MENDDMNLPRPPEDSDQTKLQRAPDDKVVAGVLGGLARYLGWDASRLRIGYVLVSLLSAGFPGLLVYIVLWFLMPVGPAGREFKF
jgi:phage shock protein PspC (stress-responsive transcriptional regulator)